MLGDSRAFSGFSTCLNFPASDIDATVDGLRGFRATDK